MKSFNISGRITLDVDLDIDANTEEEALKQAKEIIKDYYHLNVIGAYHNPEEDVKIDVDAIEYSE